MTSRARSRTSAIPPATDELHSTSTALWNTSTDADASISPSSARAAVMLTKRLRAPARTWNVASPFVSVVSEFTPGAFCTRSGNPITGVPSKNRARAEKETSSPAKTARRSGRRSSV